MELKEKIRKTFLERFNEPGTVYASAGRINLIGEHTDYNGGFVFPGAIDKVIMAEIRPNGMEKVRVFSIDINEYVEFGLKEEDAPNELSPSTISSTAIRSISSSSPRSARAPSITTAA